MLEALSSVADISGLHLEETCNGDEGELVEKIVHRVLEKVKRPGMSHLTRYTIGLNEKVESFKREVLKNQQSEKGHVVGVVGIVGMGGIGKTTLAIELFNRESSNYEKSCFLHDVRASKNSLHVLQRQLLEGLGMGKSGPNVNNPYQGKNELSKHLSSSFSKLIVLDNVDHRDQVDALLPDLGSVLSSSSFVLMTSRDIDVLTSSGVEKSSIYHLDGLNPHYSPELFCQHAFSKTYPPLQFKDRVDKFVTFCGGLPLSLEVFGALLYGETDISCWDAHLDRLQKELDSSIEERLPGFRHRLEKLLAPAIGNSSALMPSVKSEHSESAEELLTAEAGTSVKSEHSKRAEELPGTSVKSEHSERALKSEHLERAEELL